MADCIDLDNFTLSSPDLGISLSVSSHLYVTHYFAQEITYEDIRHLVQSGELGFLPSTACHLQVIVLFAGSPADPAESGSGFLEFLSHAIYSSEVGLFYARWGITADLAKLWQRLGLAIQCTRVQYEAQTLDTPNLYFEFEHPDKSEALLSPAGMITPCVDGLVCRFDFNSYQHRGGCGRQRSWSGPAGGPGTRRAGANRSNSPTRQVRAGQKEPVSSPNQAQHELDEVGQRRRKCTALLAIAALYRITGIGVRFPGVRGMTSDSTALLDLAPAVCSAHYMKVGEDRSNFKPGSTSIDL